MIRLRAVLASALSLLATQAIAVGGLVDLTVFDRTQNVRLPVHWHEGRAYVAGRPGNEYSVSVRSRHGADVLAVVSVDGVNVVSGETATPHQGGYVLSAYRSLDIRGWRKNLAETAAFYFTSLGDSYAARTGRPDNVGVIGVAIYKRRVEPPQPISRIAPMEDRRDAREAPWPRREHPAAAPAPFAGSGAATDSARAEGKLQGDMANQPQPSARSAEPGAPIGTGHGRREQSHARYVGFERSSSDPVESITLYYDSRENLLARGVIRAPIPIAPRQPHPFPGFVPDPVSVLPMPGRAAGG